MAVFLTVFFPSISQTLRHVDKQECFMLLVGKDASKDGSVLLAHNNDLSGIEASHVVKYPGKINSSYDVVTFPSGLTIPESKEIFTWLTLKITKGFEEGDAVAINEHGVAIAGGVALKSDRNMRAIEADPLIDSGLTGGVRYVALQRSRTARECVKILGELYNQYGVTYPSGVGIADTSEIWYVESGGGFSWAAVRIPDSCYWVQANGYRIGLVNPADTINYYCSPGLLEFCWNNGLWKPESKEFNFAEAFGGGRVEKNHKPFYDTRRVWQAVKILSPSQTYRSDERNFQQFFVPDIKISLEACFSVLRNRYEGSEFEFIIDDSGEDGERPIASWNAVHTNVIQLYPGEPIDHTALLWAGLGPPKTCLYVPFLFGINSIHPKFSQADASGDTGSMFWSAYDLAKMVRGNPSFLSKIEIEQKHFESAVYERITNLIIQANNIYQNSPQQTIPLITKEVMTICDEAYQLVDQLSR